MICDEEPNKHNRFKAVIGEQEYDRPRTSPRPWSASATEALCWFPLLQHRMDLFRRCVVLHDCDDARPDVVIGEATGNLSQVDRVWTFLPPLYTVHWMFWLPAQPWLMARPDTLHVLPTAGLGAAGPQSPGRATPCPPHDCSPSVSTSATLWFAC